MTGQDWATALCVILAVAYLAWQWLAPRKPGCGGGCACPTKPTTSAEPPPTFVPSDSLRLRR